MIKIIVLIWWYETRARGSAQNRIEAVHIFKAVIPDWLNSEEISISNFHFKLNKIWSITTHQRSARKRQILKKWFGRWKACDCWGAPTRPWWGRRQTVTAPLFCFTPGYSRDNTHHWWVSNALLGRSIYCNFCSKVNHLESIKSQAPSLQNYG